MYTFFGVMSSHILLPFFFSFCGAPARPGLHFHMVLLPGRAGPGRRFKATGGSRELFFFLFFFPFLEKKII
jgi:hypothetical protein